MTDALARADEMAQRYERSLANQRKLIDTMQRKLLEVQRLAGQGVAGVRTPESVLVDIVGVVTGEIPT